MTEYADGYEPGAVFMDDWNASISGEIAVDEMSEEQRRAYREMMEGLQEWARAAAEAARLAAERLREALVAALTDLWEPVTDLIQEIAEAADSCDTEQEDDRHDGAVLILVHWLPPAPQLRHLYGQGVDYGGPGPRPGLIRPADDGPRRAETGIHTEEETTCVFL